MAESNKFFLVDWFISEGITPHWPANSVWSDLDNRISKLIGTFNHNTPIGGLLNTMLTGEDGEPLQYTLSAAPVIATYIDWASTHDQLLHSFIDSTAEVVLNHPMVNSALSRYLSRLNPAKQYHEIESVARILTSQKAPPLMATEAIQKCIEYWIPFAMDEPEYLYAIAVTIRMLEHPIFLPTPMWDLVTEEIAANATDYFVPPQAVLADGEKSLYYRALHAP